MKREPGCAPMMECYCLTIKQFRMAPNSVNSVTISPSISSHSLALAH